MSEAWQEDGFEAENDWDEDDTESELEEEDELDPDELVPGGLRDDANWDDLDAEQ